MDRRNFLKGFSLAAFAGAALPMAGFGAAKATADGAEVSAKDWLSTDVVVAGGGPAGVCGEGRSHAAAG